MNRSKAQYKAARFIMARVVPKTILQLSAPVPSVVPTGVGIILLCGGDRDSVRPSATRHVSSCTLWVDQRPGSVPVSPTVAVQNKTKAIYILSLRPGQDGKHMSVMLLWQLDLLV